MDPGCRSRVPTLCLISLLVLVFSGCSGQGENRRPKNVQVSLRSNWHGTSLLLEAGELLSKEWKDLFWEFTELWIEPDKASNCSTARCCVEKIVADGRSLLSGHLGSIFEFSLTLRSASPRLALYRQLAEASLSSFPIDDEANSLTAWSLRDGLKADHSYISTNPLKSARSCCWIDTGSTLLFNVPELRLWLDEATTPAADSQEKHELFDFDHVYLGSSTHNRVAILYGAVGTKCFQEFHVILAEASLKGKIKYVARPVLPSWCQSAASFCAGIGALDAINLGGYGVELALKNMEYKAMDDSTIKKGVTLEDPRTEDLSQEVRGFIFSRILERKPELTGEIMAFRDYLLSSAISDTLEVWELKDLGHQTAQRIVHSLDPLQSMVEINQNFPSIVSSLSRMKLNESVKEEIIANQRMVPPGKSLMALNGALINIEEVDLYQLIDMVHEELSMADQFSKIKVPQKTIQKLLSVPPPSESTLFRIDFRSSHVHYLNNLEEDAMYKRWRSNINELLMPVFPGQFRYIRKNLFHAVYVFDPATACGAETVDMILAMYQNSVPMRFGVILYSSKFVKHIENQVILLRDAEDDFNNGDDVSSLIIKLFLYIKESYDSQLAFKFLNNVNKIKDAADLTAEDIVEVHMVEEAFVETVLSKAKSPPHETLLELEKESNFKEKVEGSSHFVYKLGLYKLQCCLLLNGLVHETSEDSSINAMNEELPRIQEQVYYGQITSNTDVLDKFLSESGYHRYNPQVIGKREYKNKFVTLFNSYLAEESILRNVSYFHSPGTIDDLKPVSHILAANVMSLKGIELLREGLHYLIDGSDKARVGVVTYAYGVVSSPALLLAEIFDWTASMYSGKSKVLHFLDQVCYFYGSQFMDAHLSDAISLQSFVEKVCELALENDLPSDDVRSALLNFSADLKLQQMEKVLNCLHGQLGIEFGSNAVITNGRVLVSKDSKPFSSADFELLEYVEYELRIKHIYDIIAEVEWLNMDPDELTSKFYSDAIMLISSAMSNHERSSDRAHFEILNAQHSAIILNSGNSNIHIDAVIDPLSASGQKLSPFLLILWKRIQPSMRIILNPVSSLVDLPLKNYYRFVIPSMDDYSPLDNSVGGPKAYFTNMPLTKTLTMNLDVPEPWLVEPVIAIHDLDNILLENLGDTTTLQAVFELEALLLTGHCSEKDHDPPRGLQLILATKQLAHLVDTLVMANLGYWQMKVLPGAWYLQLAPGRSADLYEMIENNEEKHTSLLKQILINDLRGKLVHLEVRKKRGKELEELLGGFEDSNPKDKKEVHTGWNANLLKWASGFITGNGISKKRNETSMGNMKIRRRGETVNIFSVASGHLYERFLKIMILSVLKNTQRPLKFWFIKNYLSPQFKVIIPRMAQEYGFEYELITYKWPTWLHKQKEKQRIIWAYKILFLDVIFPLSLKKVIFVDADQVVRTDMGVLYDMDLKGRPLAYTPFCDNNKDMDGYRFWRQGFWKDHLRGKPYHISALYVVDLVKFRQMAAGDTLRVYYETLSKDPNSLSNLDQDLPNYAQHTVPIFSLPQEWLWCESWCGNSTKSKAKTIDLCNNPMTKEPKLQGAKRIIPEWVELDEEARRLTARVFGEEEPEAVPPNSSDKTDDLESMAEL